MNNFYAYQTRRDLAELRKVLQHAIKKEKEKRAKELPSKEK